MTGFVRVASPDTPAALPTERSSHAAVAVDSDLLILGGESNAELVHEMCMIDTQKQVSIKSPACIIIAYATECNNSTILSYAPGLL